MDQPDIKPQLKELQQTINTLTAFKESEKQKYKVGIILKESIDELRRCISSFEQFLIRGEKVNTAKRNNFRSIILIMQDLLDLSLILGVGSRSAVNILQHQLEVKLARLKTSKKTGSKVSP